MVERENTKQEVEFRKIQYSGKSSFTIALPKKWVVNQKLNAGDQLSVYSDNSNNLVLSAEKNSKEKKLTTMTIDQSDGRGQIERKIIATYISGYTEINIRSKQERITPQQRATIKKLVRNKLVGSEIIEESNLIISIQVILNPEEFNIENTLRRMSAITQGMHGDIIYAIKNHDIEMCNEIIKTDDDVDRFSLYSVRQLRFALENERSLLALGVSNKIYCLGYRMISKSLERIADHAMMMGQQLIVLNKPLPKNVVLKLDEFSKFSISNLDNAMKALFKKNYKLADQVVTSCLLASKMERRILNANV
ncbi:MAG: phosphate uptake regulator PhoU, partial [Nitrososphaerales archaeon]|nr:phosphate uptake regulator PhoU [Nitrososphaerales archaeon]